MSDRGRKRPDSRPPDPVTPASPAIGRTPTPREPPLSRTTTPPAYSPHPIGTPLGHSPNSGSFAVASWMRDRGIYPPASSHWRVQIALELNDRPASFTFAQTKFQITVAAESWGFLFMHGDRTSTIHVTNMATARDRDEHRLLAMTPPLRRIGTLVRDLEARYRIFFPRHHAAIQTDISGSEPMIRAWISSF